MTLNPASGFSPPSQLHISPHNTNSAEAASTRRRNTVGSPTSAVFKPATIAPSNNHHRNSSKTVSPHRRRQQSRSPERGIEQTQQGGSSAGTGYSSWVGNGRKNDNRQNHLNPKRGPFNMQGKRNDIVQQPIAVQRPSFRHSPHSMSMPSTPNYHQRHMTNGISRSPSPPTCMLDSPRSAASEPLSATMTYSKAPPPSLSGCKYETLLVDAKRRVPYSLGSDRLKPEKPLLEKLPLSREEALTRDMELEFERLKPSKESEERRRKFLDKLSRILNEEWPGHDTKVHAFGSTENHLCMEDSDGRER